MRLLGQEHCSYLPAKQGWVQSKSFQTYLFPSKKFQTSYLPSHFLSKFSFREPLGCPPPYFPTKLLVSHQGPWSHSLNQSASHVQGVADHHDGLPSDEVGIWRPQAEHSLYTFLRFPKPELRSQPVQCWALTSGYAGPEEDQHRP